MLRSVSLIETRAVSICLLRRSGQFGVAGELDSAGLLRVVHAKGFETSKSFLIEGQAGSVQR